MGAEEKEMSFTSRGFATSEPIRCTYGSKVTVRESSAAEHVRVWLFIDTPVDINAAVRMGEDYDGEYITSQAHLSPEQVRAVISNLENMLEYMGEDIS